MRSRWSAFALGLGGYLYDTLASGHPDRAAPRDVAARELSRVRETQRFMKLTIVHAGEDEVLFVARIFEKGKDRSFAELSHFVREEDGGDKASSSWRYESGVLVPADRLPEDISTLDRESFLALA